MALHMILHVIVDSIAEGAQGDIGARGSVPPGYVSPAVVDLLKPALMTFGNIQCTYEPAGSVDELIAQALGAKMKFTKRQRPHPMQLWRILSRKVDGEYTGNEAAKSRVELFKAAVDSYNESQAQVDNKINKRELCSLLFLDDQLPEFRQRLAQHWHTYPAANSAVTVTALATPCLTQGPSMSFRIDGSLSFRKAPFAGKALSKLAQLRHATNSYNSFHSYPSSPSPQFYFLFIM
jgi:hypothetical protein